MAMCRHHARRLYAPLMGSEPLVCCWSCAAARISWSEVMCDVQESGTCCPCPMTWIRRDDVCSMLHAHVYMCACRISCTCNEHAGWVFSAVWCDALGSCPPPFVRT